MTSGVDVTDSVLVVAGDFNSKSPACSSGTRDGWGNALERFTAALELWPENVGSVPTFAVGDRSSVIDVTFARLPRVSSIRRWRVRADIFSNSDLEYTLSINHSRASPTVSGYGPNHVWARHKLDTAKLEARLKADALVPHNEAPSSNVSEAVSDLQRYLEIVSDHVMPRRGCLHLRRTVFWWTEDIAALKRACVLPLRVFQRVGQREVPRAHLDVVFCAARKSLRLEIRKVQEKS